MMRATALALLAAASAASAESVSLDPVVVTGSREPAPSSALPFSISVVEGEALEQAAAQASLADALARIPGLYSASRGNYAQDQQLSARGYGARASFGVRGLRLYADGIPAATPDGQGQLSHFAPGRGDRIEVLRGPFSALYGASSGGVIVLRHEAPERDSARLSLDNGAFGFAQQRLDLAGARGEWHGAADLSRLEVDGFRPHSAARRALVMARGGWDSAAQHVAISASRWDQPAQDPLGLTRAQFDADPRQAAPSAIAFDTRKEQRQSQLGVQWRGSGLEVAAWAGQCDVVQWQAIPVAAQSDPRHPGGVIGLDRTSAGVDARSTQRLGEAELVAGLAVEQQREQRRGYENFVNGGAGGGAQLGVTGALRRDERTLACSVDPYIQLTVPVTGRLLSMTGLRGGELVMRSEDRYLANGDDSGERTFRYLNPVAGLLYHASSAWALYANAGHGYEMPTLNELAYRGDGSAGLNPAIEAQRSWQYEGGAKWRDGARHLDVALFRADTEREIVVLSNAGGRASFQNAGRTRRRGAEAGFGWRGERWQALAALGWLDARYRDGFLTCGPPPCASASVPVASGNRLPAAPRESAYLELARAWPLLELAAEWRGAGRRAVNDLNDDFAAGYGVFALRAQKRWDVGRWRLELSARGDNLLDSDYAPSVIVNEANGRYFEPGAPRSASLSLSAEWGA